MGKADLDRLHGGYVIILAHRALPLVARALDAPVDRVQGAP